jgi:hypothetical protein
MANDGDPPLTFTWVKNRSTGRISCVRSLIPGCFPAQLRVRGGSATEFHDDQLANATQQINAQLAQIQAADPRGRMLELAIVPSSDHTRFELLLIWSEMEEDVGAFSPFSLIEQELGLTSP